MAPVFAVWFGTELSRRVEQERNMVSVYSSMAGGVSSTSLINRSERSVSKSLAEMSSGKSINKASDNAAGLAIATQLMSDVSTLRQTSTNMLQGTSVLQTADGGLDQAGQILNRMKELSTQANSGSLDANSRTAINGEYQNLKTELNGISSNTTFNGQNLLNGTYNNNFQAGTTGTDVISADLTAVNVSSIGLGLTAGAGDSATALSTPASAQATSAELDTAIHNLSAARTQVGSIQSSFETRNDVIDTQIENTISAQSDIMDADIGKSMSEFKSSKLLNDLSLAAAAQGNNLKSSLLKLVRS